MAHSDVSCVAPTARKETRSTFSPRETSSKQGRSILFPPGQVWVARDVVKSWDRGLGASLETKLPAAGSHGCGTIKICGKCWQHMSCNIFPHSPRPLGAALVWNARYRNCLPTLLPAGRLPTRVAGKTAAESSG